MSKRIATERAIIATNAAPTLIPPAEPPREPAPRRSLVVPRAATTVGHHPGAAPEESVVEGLVATLVALGVERAFAVFGGSIAPFCEALNRSPIQLLHFRHEGGAAFAAIEDSLATGRLTVVVSTTGPGLTNSLTGMVAARSEGARVLFVSGGTSAAQRGRMPFQETSPEASLYPSLFAKGPLLHCASVLEDPAQLSVLSSRLASGIARPGGFVGHVGLPLATQTARAPKRERVHVEVGAGTSASRLDARRCARLLSQGSFVIWAGFGARDAARSVRELSALTSAKVMCTPRAKGVIPESDPRYLGVTGLGGHAEVHEHLARNPPDRILVLGTRLGEMSSFWSAGLLPRQQLIHVDVDADVFGAAYPGVETLGIVADIGAFVDALMELWPRASLVSTFEEPRPAGGAERASKLLAVPRPSGAVRPSYLMARVQEAVVERTRAPVLAEAGNAFSLATHYLRFPEPKRYRVSTSFGSMGQAAAGVVGAALARGGKAVAILGDGAMLMQNEINTAAAYGIDAVWIVLNDARYGMIAQGMESIGWQPFETDFPRTDFVAIARAMGGDGVRVTDEGSVAAALERALQAHGPFVVDVVIDPTERAPAAGRNQSLMEQGVNGAEP